MTEPTTKGPGLRIERGLCVGILAAMVVLPIYAVTMRWFTGQAMAGANLYVQSLNLWVAFLGGALAAGAGKHLSLSTGQILNLEGRTRELVDGFTSAVATAVTALLAYASFELMLAERGSAAVLWGGVPMWVVQIVMPVGFGLMAIRLAWHGNRSTGGRVAAVLTVCAACALVLVPEGERTAVVWAGTAIIMAAVAMGAPLYTAMGGVAMLLFYGAPIPIALSAVPAETYRIVASPTLPCLPLFTLAGYLLAEGGASRRLVGLFRAWFGWMPGGIGAAAVLVCAFFTTFTGASGVTILALGGLLFPILVESGYKPRFAIGLIVASGSIGLLFPPSLPVILYGVVSHVPIDELFIAGAIPGAVLVLLLVGMAVYQAIRHDVERSSFDLSEAARALWAARWEALLPVLVLVGFFGGLLTIFEAAAFTAAYAFFTEVVIHRDLDLREDVPRVFVECATLMGGVLIILGAALAGWAAYRLSDFRIFNLEIVKYKVLPWLRKSGVSLPVITALLAGGLHAALDRGRRPVRWGAAIAAAVGAAGLLELPAYAYVL
ncbi:MAG: TRAP transporter large permease subunit, partial [Myxococcota bacterium]|nr:TRAP transporter large permease subunit [Myxococcota bacterium]